jgi:hypothetical protein
MKLLTGIISEPIQTFILPIDEEEATIKLQFAPVVQQWFFNVIYNGVNVNGVKLSLGVLHLRDYNFPFDFILQDTSNAGIDPFQVDDFFTGRIKMYILDAVEMAAIRGYNVKV